MKFPSVRRSKVLDAGVEVDCQAIDEGSSDATRQATTVEPIPSPPTDNLVASSFDDQAGIAREYGRIEVFDGRYLSGWYFQTSKQSSSLRITFDDEELCRTLTDVSRLDVVEANPHAPEHCGFFVDLEKHDILVRCANLADLYSRFKVVGAFGAHLAHFYSNPFVAALKPTNEKGVTASFDGVEQGVVRGWALGAKRKNAPLIHIMVDGVFQGTARTGLHREDIGSQFGDFNAGFSFVLAQHCQDSRLHTVECLKGDTGEHLSGSPKEIVLKSKYLEDVNHSTVLLQGFSRLQDEIRILHNQIKASALTGIPYFVNYSFFQDIVHPSSATLATLKKRVSGAHAPLLSIVMPTYKTDYEVLSKAIDSVVAQTDNNWELVISDSASDPVLRNYLRLRSEQDPRIRVILNDEKLGISDNTNVALKAAAGEYIGFMDHDDELAPEAISLNRAAFATGLYDIVYSDEDKIDQNGNFVEPHYKTAFDFDLLLCMNYMCHLVFVRRTTLFETELARRVYDGAQDWDLLLQLMRRVDPKRVGHIPRVLYHWRMVPGSTATSIGEKSYAVNAGLEAVKDYLSVTGTEADAEPLPGDLPYVDVRWHTKAGDKVSVIIPTKDRIDLVTNCINSIFLTTQDIDFEILIVDNNSTPSSSFAFEHICDDPRVRLITYDGAFNYAAINNFAAQQANGNYILLLNNDVFFTRRGWLSKMLGIAQRPDVGAVGLKLLYPDNTVQHCGVILGNGGVAGHAFVRLPQAAHGYFARTSCTHEVSAVTAACLLVRSEAFWNVGGLDERDLKIAFNDVDFCMKVQDLGLRNILVATTFAYHAESLSRGYEDTLEKVARFESETATMLARWGKRLTSDRFYSPNLDLNHACYTVIDLVGIAEQEMKLSRGSLVR